MTPREKELQGVLLEMADALRGKARVALNDHVSGNITDPVAILRAAADELQLAAGASLEKATVNCVPIIYGLNSLSVTRDGKTHFWSAEDGPAALVRIDISQDQINVLDPRSGKPFFQRPTGLHMAINIDPTPSAEYIEVNENEQSRLH